MPAAADAARDFRVSLVRLPTGPSRLVLEGPPAAVGLEPESWPAPLVLELNVDRQGDQITLQGHGRTEIAEECGRCLVEFRGPLEFEFHVFADRGSGDPLEQELEAEDYVVHHDGRVLDLGEQAREQAILARPMSSLCRPDCAGLCPRCGADRNQGECVCQPAPPEGAAGARRATP